MHSKNPGFKPGDYWAECELCGFEYRQSRLKKQWDGLKVCERCWSPRHPQDFARSAIDNIAPQGIVSPARPVVYSTGTAGSGGASQTIPLPTHGSDPNL